MLGAENQCNAPFPYKTADAIEPTVIVIVNAVTGALVTRVLPNADMLSTFKAVGDPAHEVIAYYGLAWSPDGQELAAPFFIDRLDPTTHRPEPGTHGYSLLLMRSDGSGVRVLTQAHSRSLAAVLEWNLSRGAAIPLSGAAFAAAFLQPPALTYAWKADGSLAATAPLSQTTPNQAPALTPIGNPDGGATFTVWQPMSVGILAQGGQTPAPPYLFVARAQFLAWSPDGAYLLEASMGPWPIQPSKQPAARADIADELPVRDPALDAEMNQWTIDPQRPELTGGRFAWHPDGQLLAATPGLDLAVVTSVDIRDCASGALLATIPISQTSQVIQSPQASAGVGLAWSPDGQRLLVLNGAELIVLDPPTLPQA
jgi:hypothetical protein